VRAIGRSVIGVEEGDFVVERGVDQALDRAGRTDGGYDRLPAVRGAIADAIAQRAADPDPAERKGQRSVRLIAELDGLVVVLLAAAPAAQQADCVARLVLAPVDQLGAVRGELVAPFARPDQLT